MSYTLLSETHPHAKKDYQCIWCGEKIEKGLHHIHKRSIYDGDFQDQRFHIECDKAADKVSEIKHGDFDFNEGDFKRGSTEER